MDPSAGVLELLGVVLSGGAWLCSLATTLMPTWLTLSTDLLPAESYELGLWETCVVQDTGSLECRPYDSLLGLSPDIRLARILMCTVLGAGLLGLLLAIPGLDLVNGCRGDHKRALKAAGGTLSVAAGVLGLVPVSYVAHLAVLRFFDDSVPDVLPRWEFGDALFCGWTAAVLHLVAGTLLLTSCLRRHDCDAPVHIRLAAVPPRRRAVGTRTRTRTRTEYV
ncbi:claudin-22-like [Embiotoca jacksoni]|uniref:claudin-22-like n=1 Tax=Embiotoca jacksoni TaxID=100190 RepID=UPI003703EB99